MKLWVVTWATDLTQFLINADTQKEAVDKAVNAHLAYHTEIWGTDGDENRETLKDIHDISRYQAEAVDFELLCEIMERQDKVGTYKDAYVLFGA